MSTIVGSAGFRTFTFDSKLARGSLNTTRHLGVPAPRFVAKRSINPSKAQGSSDDRSSSDSFINKVTVALSNSPINQGKIWLAKQQAGDYDEAAYEAKLLQLIEETPVLMFSFTT